MPLPPLPTQIADQINLSRQKTPDLKNPPKKMKKALAPSWAQEVEANVDIDDDLSAAEAALEQIKTIAPAQHLEKLLPAFKALLQGWLAQGHELVTMGQLHRSWLATGQLDKIATEPLQYGSIANRSGELMIQMRHATNFT